MIYNNNIKYIKKEGFSPWPGYELKHFLGVGFTFKFGHQVSLKIKQV